MNAFGASKKAAAQGGGEGPPHWKEENGNEDLAEVVRFLS